MIVIKNAKFGTLTRYVGRPLAILFAIDVAVAVAYVFAGWKWLALPDVPLSIFGGVIGIIAGFRNTSAYARWWEARTVWGSIVNQSRSFAREVLTMIAGANGKGPPDEIRQVQRTLIYRQIAYVHALRNQLRDLPALSELCGLLAPQELEFLKTQKNVALAIQQHTASIVACCYERGWLDEIRWVRLDQTLSVLMDSQGASERIKNTPMPRMYDFFVRLFIDFFCIVLPLGMVAPLGLWTPFGSTLVGFMFLAIDKIGRDLENPFENLPHDISLTAISRTIEINLKQMIGETEIPQPLTPADGVLW